MSAQLFLPGWLVARLDDEHRAFAEEMTIQQAGGGTAEWIEHDGGLWEVRVD